MSREIRSITFAPDGLVIEYVDLDQDIRSNGLVMNHALRVPDDSTYHDAIVEVDRTAAELLTKAMDDWLVTDPLVIETDTDDGGPSPYDNPLERDLDGLS